MASRATSTTDLRCLDILERLGPMTAGELAAQSGLTSGATKTPLDRLERADYATRTRDTVDRRKVLVDITPIVRGFAEEFYGRQAGEWSSRGINVARAAQLRREIGAEPPSAA